MGYKVSLASVSSHPEANLGLDFKIRWATVKAVKDENEISMVMKGGTLHCLDPTENQGIVSRFNEERILCAIRNNPNVGNVWFDYGDERSDVSLVFTIISAADMGGRTRLLYISPEWRDVLAVAEWRIALDRYQVLFADSDAKGDIHMELTVVVEYLINLLERQGCNVTGLPVDWKELRSGVLFNMFKKAEMECRSRLLKDITSLGAWADQSADIFHLQRLLEDLRQSVPQSHGQIVLRTLSDSQPWC